MPAERGIFPAMWHPKRKVRYIDGPLRGEFVETNAQRLYVELKTWKVRIAVYDLIKVFEEEEKNTVPYFKFLGWIDDPTIDASLKKYKPAEKISLKSGKKELGSG